MHWLFESLQNQLVFVLSHMSCKFKISQVAVGFGELGGNWEARKIQILRGSLKSRHHQFSKKESQFQGARF